MPSLHTYATIATELFIKAKRRKWYRSFFVRIVIECKQLGSFVEGLRPLVSDVARAQHDPSAEEITPFELLRAACANGEEVPDIQPPITKGHVAVARLLLNVLDEDQRQEIGDSDGSDQLHLAAASVGYATNPTKGTQVELPIGVLPVSALQIAMAATAA